MAEPENTGQGSPLEFPCAFPIKAMGLASNEMDVLVVDIIAGHVPDLDESKVTTRASKNGKYLSVTVVIEADSQRQLDDIYRELSAHEHIMMTL